MKYSFEEIINNNSFWLYFVSTQFPNAFDDEADMGIDEFISENYEPDDEWIDGFVQYYDGVMDESDGYVDNPNFISLNLNNHDFKIEFHAGDTLYFLDGVQIGCTGPHFILGALSFDDFSELLKNVEDIRFYLLVLPMLKLKKHNVLYVNEILKSALYSVGFCKEDSEFIAKMISDSLL